MQRRLLPTCAVFWQRLAGRARRRLSGRRPRRLSSEMLSRPGVLRVEVHILPLGDRRSARHRDEVSRREDSAECMGFRRRPAWTRRSCTGCIRETCRDGDCHPPSGHPVEGKVVRIDDFLITLEMADGSTRTFARDGDVPKVEVRDPMRAHRDLLRIYTDQDMHDVTAYLVTLK